MKKSVYNKIMTGLRKFLFFTVNLGRSTKPRPLPSAEFKGHYFAGLNLNSEEQVSMETLNKAFKLTKEEPKKVSNHHNESSRLMNKIGNEQNSMFDVDDTIVMHVRDNSPADLVLYNDAMECNIALKIHTEHVKQIKSHKNRGFTTIVWSGNGADWAEKVIKALELEKYVDYYMTKPVKFFDDLPAEEVLVNRVYLPFKENT